MGNCGGERGVLADAPCCQDPSDQDADDDQYDRELDQREARGPVPLSHPSILAWLGLRIR